ncbi:MAG: radical SAM protein [Chloroflexi bacterium]|nr:radical SAM protein [Chloroflexota bacterium]
MISVSRLLCDTVSPGDHLRYEPKKDPRPVVVWNCTRQCNLKCIHCYASASNQRIPGEMGTPEGKQFIRDLAEFGVPVLLFSGGEPLIRKDLFELADFAKQQGMRLAMSTNGTLIDEDAAREIQRLGFAEVGISLDGIGDHNDYFRGKTGAFEAALTGIRNCNALGIRVSLRLTITKHNYRDIPAIFKLIEDEKVDRICLYHLAYSGRGNSLQKEDLDHAQTRAVIDTVCEHTVDLYQRGFRKEVLMVANHADGIYLYLKAKEQDPERADKIMRLLKMNGGNNSGIRIGAVDNMGEVHADQFWWHYSVGNVLKRKFGDIWTDTSEPLLKGLKDRKGLLKGRCARCNYLDICNGNLRVRAEAVYGDVWADDPACYLTDEEIGLG